MASNYDISLGSDTIEILTSDKTYTSIQLTGSSSLNSDISVSIKESSDAINFISISDTIYTIPSGGDSIKIDVLDYTLDVLYLDIDVLSATVGEIDIFITDKKKDDSTSTTISGVVDIINPESLTIKELLRDNLIVQNEILCEQRITNEILMESFNVEVTKNDIDTL